MLSVSRVEFVKNHEYSFKGNSLENFAQYSQMWENPEWYSAKQITDNANQVANLLPKNFHPIIDTFMNGFSVLFSFMLANWSGEKLLNKGDEILNKVRDKINKTSNKEIQNIGIIESFKNKILSCNFVKNHKNLSTFLSNSLELTRKFSKSAKHYVPLGLGFLASATTFASQRAEKQTKKNVLASNKTNNIDVSDKMIQNYINSIRTQN